MILVLLRMQWKPTSKPLEGSRCENGDGEDVAKLFEKDIGTYQDSFVAEEIGGALIGRNDIEEYFDEVACDVATYEFLDGIIEEAECEGDICSFWGFALVGVDFNDGGECVFEVAFYGSVFDVDRDDKKKGKRRRLGGSDVEFLNLNFPHFQAFCLGILEVIISSPLRLVQHRYSQTMSFNSKTDAKNQVLREPWLLISQVHLPCRNIISNWSSDSGITIVTPTQRITRTSELRQTTEIAERMESRSP